jgi:hypothetical protein
MFVFDLVSLVVVDRSASGRIGVVDRMWLQALQRCLEFGKIACFALSFGAAKSDRMRFDCRLVTG